MAARRAVSISGSKEREYRKQRLLFLLLASCSLLLAISATSYQPLATRQIDPRQRQHFLLTVEGEDGLGLV
jgi:hypothetical protein